MPIPLIEIDCSKISNNDSLHIEFREKLGFPSFYGKNMDAWIDCLTYLDVEDGMRSVTINPGQVLTLQLIGYKELKKRRPDLAEAIVECSAFVNFRRIMSGDSPVLALSFE